MIEFACFHNGTSDLPPKRGANGYWYNDGSLGEVHQAAQRELHSQVRQGVLAEQLGFKYWFQTEHHFQAEGAERNSVSLLVEAAIAAQTSTIRLGQMANIVPWWHPLRLAEYAAGLDVLSNGRLEFGVGRGYSPREGEVWGHLLGASIQDQEKNRSWYEESIELIKRAWTEDSFSFHGEFFQIPPSWTKWGHAQSEAFYADPKVQRLEQALKLGAPDGTGGPAVVATTQTLREVSVFPQPLQKPYPQMWTPVTSDRSVRYAAEQGMNAFFSAEPNANLRRKLAIYYDAAEEAGWPDRHDLGEFKFGWDAERKRGVVPCRMIHVTDPGVGDPKRAADAVNLMFSYHSAFGVLKSLADEHGNEPAPGDYFDAVTKSGVALYGSTQQVIDGIMTIKEECGYDEFLLTAWFETQGFATEEIETQMHHFAENIMPVLRRECGSDISLNGSVAQAAAV